ncbi:MAG TPA: neutral/alkaline non-lysosomal ceramidase N-terminal domain-containing protein [Terriglobia bacterium]|nr:neutral/alkaline non-lysosomal ceramidase N-terminal domain-containing protein [Terriglobia bacterium]
MRQLVSLCTLCSVVILGGACTLSALGAPQGTLSVGAARVDVTPPADAALPMSGCNSRKEGFQKIHDHIYARAIVLSDGAHQAAILSWELIGMPDGVWQQVSQRISRELGIPADHVILAGEHVHSAPTVAGAYTKGTPDTIAYTTKLEDYAFQAVKQAKANLQPARFGFGVGRADVNINRREQFPDGEWDLGYNPEGPSDKTVAVLKFETLAGKPIALLINYAVHGVVMGPDNLEVSGDLPGATSRFVEQYYRGDIPTRSDGGWDLQLQPQEKADGVVALWTSGAAGDQNPIVMDEGNDFSMVDALGRILGEETVRVANNIKNLSPEASVWGGQRVINCPGRTVVPGPHPHGEYKFEDAGPVDIRLSLLMLNNIAVAGVSGEVLTPIFLRLARESPFHHTIIITHANGLSGYIPNDAAYNQVSYEITTTHLKPGCAETGIVNGLVEMMNRR